MKTKFSLLFSSLLLISLVFFMCQKDANEDSLTPKIYDYAKIRAETPINESTVGFQVIENRINSLFSNLNNWPSDSLASHSKFYNSLSDIDIVYYHKYMLKKALERNIKEQKVVAATELWQQNLNGLFDLTDNINKFSIEKYGKCSFRLSEEQKKESIDRYQYSPQEKELIELLRPTESMECWTSLFPACDTFTYVHASYSELYNISAISHSCAHNNGIDLFCDTRIIFNYGRVCEKECSSYQWHCLDALWTQAVINEGGILSFRQQPISNPLIPVFELLYGISFSNAPNVMGIGGLGPLYTNTYLVDNLKLHESECGPDKCDDGGPGAD